MTSYDSISETVSKSLNKLSETSARPSITYDSYYTDQTSLGSSSDGKYSKY